ncbi:MAG TPA: SsrA-binding protein SmpB [Firmicutes bacterium]|jgi:SsrA-binding protein|nr:SsrA-binding protein SmpB [Bacillota bacterium]
MAKAKNKERIVASNRKARYDYFIMETYEAGLVLVGTEVKSLRESKASLRDSFARVENGEMFLYNMHISLYQKGGYVNHDPRRPRKLLLHKKEIQKLAAQVQEKGLTLVPLKVYFNEQGLAKVELALARGKKFYDKRDDLARRDAKREIERAFKERSLGAI